MMKKINPFAGVFLLTCFVLALPSYCPAATAIGHVVDPSGNPVVGATVYVFNFPHGVVHTSVITDPTGSFSTDLSEGDLDDTSDRACMIVAKGFAVSGGILNPGDNQFQLSLPVAISGRVVDVKGLPAANVLVTAFNAMPVQSYSGLPRSFAYFEFNPLSAQFTVRTGADGSYTISNIPSNLTVFLGLNDPKYLKLEESVPNGTLTAATMTAILGGSITGKVVRKDGKPVGVVNVAAREDGGSPTTVLSAPDGKYTLTGLYPGIYSITASAPDDNSASVDWAMPNPVSASPTLGMPSVAPDLVLVPASIITGRVIDVDDNQPVPGVKVRFQDASLQGAQDRLVTAVTDQQGKFIAHVWAGKISIYLISMPKNYLPDSWTELQTITVAEGQTVTMDDFALTHSLSIDGTVVDEQGQPVPNVSLQPLIAPQDQGTWVYVAPQTTEQNGAFELGQMVAGTYSIDAGTAWTVVSPKTFVMPASAPLNVVVRKANAIDITGKVVDNYGAPVSGVSLTFLTGRFFSNGSLESNTTKILSDNNGSYTLEDAPINPQLIRRWAATKSGYMYVSGGNVAVAGDRVTIEPIVMAKLNGTLDGTITNGSNTPVAGAWLLCNSGLVDSQPTQTDAAGRFEIDNLMAGPCDLYAAKGRYFAHMLVQVSAALSDTTITLAQLPEPPTPLDLKDGMQMIDQLLAESQTSGDRQPIDYLRDRCAALLAVISPDQALNFLGSFAELKSSDLDSVIRPQERINPAGTAKWAIPLLQRTYDDGAEGSIAATVGLDVAAFDKSSANILYDIAAKKIPLNNLNQNNLEAAESLTALAYATHRPDADDDYQKVQAAVKTTIAAVTKESAANDGSYLVSNLAVNMALGNLPLALQLLTTLPENYGPSAYDQIISELIGRDPKAAMSILHTLHTDTDLGSPWAYAQAVPTVIAYIFKSDPQSAVTLAKSVTDPHARSEALATVADLLPVAQAAPLYEEAEADSVDQNGQGSTPASIAAHAYLRDPELGKRLFAEAFKKVVTDGAAVQQWLGPSYAEFAFYYSRIDPGFSRVMLENQFSRDQKNPPRYESPGESIASDAAAMAAIDPVRALEMADSIENPGTRFIAGLKVASYLLLTQSQRDTLPFSNWAQLWGDWTPGVTTIW